eukprot:CAMPEP_0175056252 /NCGR_PEP_ID=MMETSP0052_2-20121109/10561_1 /TAXON_ID=51329 ORGANISM="Polytomella parva, Strain SAG 63-3" /NCGR_SAMPLE_ID=MMETSP0052_2 /ASSEMBLY_ACC=CAM_ASM_000194 /LENGTH=45 /DNA_ID= /DNA_START= /DNA_END= /DNA_ORIENTATION=
MTNNSTFNLNPNDPRSNGANHDGRNAMMNHIGFQLNAANAAAAAA